MKRISIISIIFVFFLLFIPLSVDAASSLKTVRDNVAISSIEEGLMVIEDIKVNNTGNENITSIQFWIQQDASDVKVLYVKEDIELVPIISGNVYTCNLTKYNITLEKSKPTDFRLSYIIANRINNEVTFEKTLSYETVSITVSFKEKELYHGESLSSGSSLRVLLYKPSEAPLSTPYLIIIFLFVIVLAISTLLLLRKQRTKVKSSIVEFEELLVTKKSLLLSLLKDIEKQHRSKDISDDTYNKLKGEYKQQAVEVMKKLEDIKKK